MYTNALYKFERLEGDSAVEVWRERIKARYGCGMGVRMLTDEYGAHWLFWDRHRLGLINPSESLKHRNTLTFDE